MYHKESELGMGMPFQQLSSDCCMSSVIEQTLGMLCFGVYTCILLKTPITVNILWAVVAIIVNFSTLIFLSHQAQMV